MNLLPRDIVRIIVAHLMEGCYAPTDALHFGKTCRRYYALFADAIAVGTDAVYENALKHYCKIGSGAAIVRLFASEGRAAMYRELHNADIVDAALKNGTRDVIEPLVARYMSEFCNDDRWWKLIMQGNVAVLNLLFQLGVQSELTYQTMLHYAVVVGTNKVFRRILREMGVGAGKVIADAGTDTDIIADTDTSADVSTVSAVSTEKVSTVSAVITYVEKCKMCGRDTCALRLHGGGYVIGRGYSYHISFIINAIIYQSRVKMLRHLLNCAVLSHDRLRSLYKTATVGGHEECAACIAKFMKARGVSH